MASQTNYSPPGSPTSRAAIAPGTPTNFGTPRRLKREITTMSPPKTPSLKHERIFSDPNANNSINNVNKPKVLWQKAADGVKNLDIVAASPRRMTKNDKKNEQSFYGANGSTHTYSLEEVTAFSQYINHILKDERLLAGKIPVEPESLVDECSDGIILCHLINDVAEGSVAEKFINRDIPLSIFKATENCNHVINAVKFLGIQIVNIGSQDITSAKPTLVLALLWQIIKAKILTQVSLAACPTLWILKEQNESVEEFEALPVDKILLRWFNHQLFWAGSNLTVTNFDKDLADGQCYAELLRRLGRGSEGSRALTKERAAGPERLAELIIDAAKSDLGVQALIRPAHILNGDSRLNMAFVSQLCNARTCIIDAPKAQRGLSKMQAKLRGDAVREKKVLENLRIEAAIKAEKQRILQAKLDAERAAKEKEERIKRELAEAKAKAEREKREAAQRAKEAEEAAKRAAERKAREAEEARIAAETAKLEAERKAKEAEQARLVEAARKREAELARLAEEAKKLEAERIAKEAAKKEAEIVARQEAELRAKKAEEAAKKDAILRALLAEEAAKNEAERAAREAARIEAEQKEKAVKEAEQASKRDADFKASEAKRAVEVKAREKAAAAKKESERRAREAEEQAVREAEYKAKLESEESKKLKAKVANKAPMYTVSRSVNDSKDASPMSNVLQGVKKMWNVLKTPYKRVDEWIERHPRLVQIAVDATSTTIVVASIPASYFLWQATWEVAFAGSL